MSDNYMPPEDPLVIKKLDQWQDLKFGLIMHWGPYSQWGIVESWSLCPEDESWTKRTGPHSRNYFEYKKAYEQLQTTFNPIDFSPGKWAKAAKKAGMKYLVFTTKHHDGFSMFDTEQTDYKITSPQTPFSSHTKSNITKEIFEAFRNESFMVGAYFSKPDWHSNYYWWSYFPPMDRNVNYSTATYPERWKKFQDFTFNQIEELMIGYGKIDILWLDGGWVRPSRGQDINMFRIANMARKHQPGLIIVDRTVTGKYENYTTPEQHVADKPLPYPWETVMTMGTKWSYHENEEYKSTDQLINTLVEIVTRGGNFLLNVAPDPKGKWDLEVYQRLEEIGEWMNINGEGIYESKPVAPYSVDDNIYFSQSADGNTIYVFWMFDHKSTDLPSHVELPVNKNKHPNDVELLGVQQSLSWKYTNSHVSIELPESVVKGNRLKHGMVFKLSVGASE